MSATCPHCGDGPNSIGTMNHIECVEELSAQREALNSRHCGTCQHYGVCSVHRAAWTQFRVAPFACACWAEVEK